jgi:hypothetical protein
MPGRVPTKKGHLPPRELTSKKTNMSQQEISIFPCTTSTGMSNNSLNFNMSNHSNGGYNIPNNTSAFPNTPLSNGLKKKGRRKIKIEFIEDKSKRHVTLSKRKAGIMKKAYELSTLTGTQCLLLIASETGHVYTFSTPKLQPLITKPEGKNLIQACLNASIPSEVGDNLNDDSSQAYPTSNDEQEYEEKKMFGTIPLEQQQQHAATPTVPQMQTLPQLGINSSHMFTQQLQQMQAQFGNTAYSALLSSSALFGSPPPVITQPMANHHQAHQHQASMPSPGPWSQKPDQAYHCTNGE